MRFLNVVLVVPIWPVQSAYFATSELSVNVSVSSFGDTVIAFEVVLPAGIVTLDAPPTTVASVKSMFTVNSLGKE